MRSGGRRFESGILLFGLARRLKLDTRCGIAQWQSRRLITARLRFDSFCHDHCLRGAMEAHLASNQRGAGSSPAGDTSEFRCTSGRGATGQRRSLPGSRLWVRVPPSACSVMGSSSMAEPASWVRQVGGSSPSSPMGRRRSDGGNVVSGLRVGGSTPPAGMDIWGHGVAASAQLPVEQ